MPTVSADFVWRMAEVLALDAEPDDPRDPVICCDESPDQLVREGRQPRPAAPGQPWRDDDDYRREGPCHVFRFFQPLQGWRPSEVTDRRPAQDFASWLSDLVAVHCPEATVISVVLDNLNTQTPAAR